MERPDAKVSSRPPALGDLPLEAVCRIFKHSDEATRRSLACVNRRLLWVSRTPALNQDVAFSLVIAPSSPEKFDSFYSWILHRRNAVETLRIDICRDRDNHLSVKDQAEAWTLLCASIVAVSTTLQKLSLHWPYPDASMGRWMTAASELQELRLNNLSLNVKECVVTLPSLQVLSLDSKLPATMDWAKESSNVTKLLLSVPGTVLPTAITKLTGLAALVLDSGMTTLPAEALSGLTSLAIVCAAAEQLPPELASLTNLRQLILEEHLFPGQQDADHLSASLAPLTQLTLLSLARCGLVMMPSAVPALPLLTDLLVDGCLFTRLPAGPYLSQLRVLSADFGVIFNSAELLREIPHLGHLFACTTTWAGMSDVDPGVVLEALRTHPALKRITILTDASTEGYVSAAANTLLLRLVRECPGLEVVCSERGTLHPHTREALCCFSLPIDNLGLGF